MSDQKNVDADINLGNLEFISVKSNLIVRMTDKFLLYDTDEAVELDIQITADLETVPEKYREVFLNMLSAKYFNKTNFADNPFSQTYSTRRNPWWKRYISNLNLF